MLSAVLRHVFCLIEHHGNDERRILNFLYRTSARATLRSFVKEAPSILDFGDPTSESQTFILSTCLGAPNSCPTTVPEATTAVTPRL